MEETDRSGATRRFPFGTFSSVVIFDLETTGLDSRSDTIIEFGGIKVTEQGGSAQKTDEADLLISLPSGKQLSDPIIRLTGITPAMLRESGTDPRLAAETVSGLLSGPDTLLAAYNAQFDLCFQCTKPSGVPRGPSHLQFPWLLRATMRSPLKSPAQVEGTQGFLPQPGKALERPSSTRLEARFPYHGSGAMTRSPSPLAWRPDFPGAPREAH